MDSSVKESPPTFIASQRFIRSAEALCSNGDYAAPVAGLARFIEATLGAHKAS